MSKKAGWKLITAIILILIIFLAGIFTYYIIIASKTTEDNQNQQITTNCTELGCPAGSVYVGSINSDKYYPCECHYAKRILPENIICFSSDKEAVAKGYIKIEC